MPVPQFKDHRAHAEALICAALQAADPAAALARRWNESDEGEVVLLAIGKGSRPMALEALRRFGSRVVAGLITTPPEQADAAEFSRWPVRVMACDHPFPTQRNLEAARAARDLVAATQPHQTLLCLITGGGSAHLTLPAEGLTIEDIAAATKALQRAGATIDELNCVRKHCEQLKGGRLAVLCGASRLNAYILSDVMGDKLDVIASGPTVPDPTTCAEALRVLRARGCEVASPAVVRHLEKGAVGGVEETPKPGHPAFGRVRNTIVASNRIVVDAVAAAAASLGFEPRTIEYDREGEASEVGKALAAKAGEMLREGVRGAYIMGGETTVTVGEAHGLGGPSQEIALAWAHAARGLQSAVLLTLSTDGRDGPTDAAGAIVSTHTAEEARREGVSLEQALSDHDAYRALDRLGALVRLPPTGTNLNHVAAVLTYPGPSS
jgi:glycerate 2-kinase